MYFINHPIHQSINKSIIQMLNNQSINQLPNQVLLSPINSHISFSGHPDDFHYLNQGDNPVIPNVDDADCFDETREAMDLVGIHQDDQFMLFRILAAVLHLGNVEIFEFGEDDECTIEVRKCKT